MRSIFISGGAQGIGRKTAEKFAAEGWLVGIGDLQECEWARGDDRIVVTLLDVASAESWDRALVEFTSRTGGSLDVLDNNAGVIIDGPLADENPAAIKKIVDINVTGLTLGARAAHPYLLRGTDPHLVNISSASAVFGQPGIAAYSASKFYVSGLTEALSLEWEKDGIRVVDMMPLWAKTSLAEVNAASVRKLGVRLRPEQVADSVWEAVNPRGRWARGRLHYGVGWMDKTLYLARSVAPDRLARFVTKTLAG